MANYRPKAAGAEEPPSGIAAPASAIKSYRAPTEKELKDIIRLFHLHEDGDGSLTANDADHILAWLKDRPDLSVDWFYDEARYGPLRKLSNIRYEFKTAHNSILAMIFMAELIPVNHPLIEELACRNPDFTLEDEDGESLLKMMGERIEYWDTRGLGVEKEWYHDNYRAKYELAKNPEALKEWCNRKYMRSGVKNVASLQLASKQGFLNKKGQPIPENVMSVITGMLTGKRGSTAQQMANAKKNLYLPSEAASSSSSSSSSAAPSPAPAPAASTTRRRRRRRWYGTAPKKGGRKTHRRLLRK